ncbi:sensor histidine kinase [Devosia psychrophila]|uniref:histidine kinase n=1 Tax=Devosia psychrophila TaxID=728005 RepID=A0A0F5PXB5_9HYPH|nr:sensor histidine kinase [Devosia psychrophila]KKC33250.1 histidine kinase [Devosia psychrophila]SFC25460.1 Two-component sensor histidine kinase, contains HisKA and HATPase domains [Devosia psychrophila]
MPLPDASHPLWEPNHLRRALHAAGVSLWSWNVESDAFSMDQHGFALWGIEPTPTVNFEDLSAKIHPADRDRVREAFNATRALVGAYEIDFRILLGDEVRWVSARGVGSDEGLYNGRMAGVFLDVTGRKQAEEGHELLAGEMSHRVKNLLAIAAGLTNLTSRSTTTAKEMAEELTARLAALGRAHDVVRPLPGHQGRAALLGDLISVLLAPYDDTAAFSGRIRVAVPRMGVGEQAATTLALVVHELATNSLKYGALSAEKGTLDISGVADEDLVCITWTERGGPAVDVQGQGEGYGSKLLNRGVSGQLGGSISTEWFEEGIVVSLKIDPARLSA